MNEISSLQTQESVSSIRVAETGPSIEFFAVGLLINLALIGAFFVWAIKQGKK